MSDPHTLPTPALPATSRTERFVVTAITALSLSVVVTPLAIVLAGVIR